ncbi:MAG: Zn-ribbon domain-containing OB-fold protein [Mycobacteriales bacterium]
MKPFVLPVEADEATASFFAATAEGALPLHRCLDCGAVSGPNELACHACRSTSYEQLLSAGTGEVVSFTVQHSKPGPDGSTHRLTAAIIALDEGPWWWTQLVVAPEDVSIGMRVRLEMVRPEGGEAVPVAVPA